MDFFEFYELPVSFKINDAGLKKTFLTNSKKYHPDFFTLKSTAEQEEALRLSTLNNEAYKTLKDFDLRMRYVLEKAGEITTDSKEVLPQDFLMEMMDVNEAIMEMQMDFNSEESKKIEQDLSGFEKTLRESIEDDLMQYEGQSDFDLSRIKNFYFKKKYLKRLRDHLDQISPEI